MIDTPVHITSDVHLGAIGPERERAFLDWLEHAGSSGARVVINGDLFDFWFEYRSAIPKGHTRVLGALAALVDAGHDVQLTGGNHDWWGGAFLEDEIGVTFHRQPVEVDLAGHRTLLAHGDGLGPGDYGYRLLQKLLRARPFTGAFRWLHPDVGAAIARGVSSTRARAEQGHSGGKSRALVLEDWALSQLTERHDLDLVLLGHTHVPTRAPCPEGGWYVNSGDWVEHSTWVELRSGHPPKLMEWPLGAGAVRRAASDAEAAQKEDGGLEAAVAGAGVSGAGVPGARVSGDGVSGEGISDHEIPDVGPSSDAARNDNGAAVEAGASGELQAN